MAYGEALKAYQKTKVETADTLELVIMCYDAAIKDFQAAQELQEKNSMDESYEKVKHAQDLITELLIGLDYERGGIIAQNLSRLYNFILRQSIGINSLQNTSRYAPLIHILSELKEAWEQARQNVGRSDASVGQSLGISA